MKIEPFNAAFGTVVTASDAESLLSLDLREVAALFRSTGLVYFRGFDVSTRDFAAFTDQFGSLDGPHPLAHPDSGVSRAEAGNGLRGVTRGTEEIEFHGEGHTVPQISELLWFCCVTPSTTGGETTVCDGKVFLANLSEQTRALFRTRRLSYVGSLPRPVWEAMLGTTNRTAVRDRLAELERRVEAVRFSLRDDDYIQTTYLVHAIQQTTFGQGEAFVNSILGPYAYIPRLEDDTPIPPEVIHELRVTGRQLLVTLPWREGDIVMIDNTRVMHGRNAFTGPRKIYQRLTQKLHLHLRQ